MISTYQPNDIDSNADERRRACGPCSRTTTDHHRIGLLVTVAAAAAICNACL
jgi:hypothetical protein